MASKQGDRQQILQNPSFGIANKSTVADHTTIIFSLFFHEFLFSPIPFYPTIRFNIRQTYIFRKTNYNHSLIRPMFDKSPYKLDVFHYSGKTAIVINDKY